MSTRSEPKGITCFGQVEWLEEGWMVVWTGRMDGGLGRGLKVWMQGGIEGLDAGGWGLKGIVDQRWDGAGYQEELKPCLHWAVATVRLETHGSILNDTLWTYLIKFPVHCTLDLYVFIIISNFHKTYIFLQFFNCSL